MLPTNFGYIFYCILLFVYIWTANWQIEFVSPSSCSSTIWKCIYIYIRRNVQCIAWLRASSSQINPIWRPCHIRQRDSVTPTFWGKFAGNLSAIFPRFLFFVSFSLSDFVFFFRFLYFLSCITCHSGARLAELIIFSKTLSRGISNSQSLPPI